MAEYTKQIHYRLNNATNDIKLYTTVEDVGANYVSLMDGGATVYAGLVDPTDSLASNVRVRRNGNIYALARSIRTPDCYCKGRALALILPVIRSEITSILCSTGNCQTA